MKRISFNYYELRLAVALEGGGGTCSALTLSVLGICLCISLRVYFILSVT